MKIKIRKSIFETNSSSTHSLILVDNSETIDLFLKGELLFNTRTEKTELPQFVTYKEVYEYVKKHSCDDNEMLWFNETFLSINDIESYDLVGSKSIDLVYYFG